MQDCEIQKDQSPVPPVKAAVHFYIHNTLPSPEADLPLPSSPAELPRPAPNSS